MFRRMSEELKTFSSFVELKKQVYSDSLYSSKEKTYNIESVCKLYMYL